VPTDCSAFNAPPSCRLALRQAACHCISDAIRTNNRRALCPHVETGRQLHSVAKAGSCSGAEGTTEPIRVRGAKADHGSCSRQPDFVAPEASFVPALPALCLRSYTSFSERKSGLARLLIRRNTSKRNGSCLLPVALGVTHRYAPRLRCEEGRASCGVASARARRSLRCARNTTRAARLGAGPIRTGWAPRGRRILALKQCDVAARRNRACTRKFGAVFFRKTWW
jgi:hypothetical protein